MLLFYDYIIFTVYYVMFTIIRNTGYKNLKNSGLLIIWSVHVLHKRLLKPEAMNSQSFSMPNMRCGGIVRFLISPLHAPCNPMSMPFALFPRYQPFFTTSVLGLVVKWTKGFIFGIEFEHFETKMFTMHDNRYGIMKNSVR